jgi:hypothetical protein
MIYAARSRIVARSEVMMLIVDFERHEVGLISDFEYCDGNDQRNLSALLV